MYTFLPGLINFVQVCTPCTSVCSVISINPKIRHEKRNKSTLPEQALSNLATRPSQTPNLRPPTFKSSTHSTRKRPNLQRVKQTSKLHRLTARPTSASAVIRHKRVKYARRVCFSVELFPLFCIYLIRHDGTQTENALRQRKGQQERRPARQRPQVIETAKRQLARGAHDPGALHLRGVRLGDFPDNPVHPYGVG